MRIPVPAPIARIVPASSTRLPMFMVILTVVLLALLIPAGVWTSGGLLTNNASLARGSTVVWLLVVGAGVLLTGLRWRQLAVPALVTWLVVSGVTVGFLTATSALDRVVDEEVTVASMAATPKASASTGPSDGAAISPTPAMNLTVAQGRFVDGAHATTGTATLIERPGGTRVLTLTGFATAPGPDLRVRLIPDDSGKNTENAVDLGALKGNKGNQQYVVPSNSPSGAVIIWCRAFSVTFGTASLTHA